MSAVQSKNSCFSLNENDVNARCFKSVKYYNAPISLIWELTGKCTSNCRYCSGNFPRKCRELTYQEKMKLVDEIIDMKVFMVNLSGGEPFFCDELEKIVDKLTKANINVMICTTGKGIDYELLKKFLKNPLVAFNLSIDSNEREINNHQRGQGSYEGVIEFLKFLSDYKNLSTFVSIETVVTKDNFSNFESLANLIAQNPVICEWRIQAVVPTNQKIYDENLKLDTQEIQMVKSKIEKLQNLLLSKSSACKCAVRFIDQAQTVKLSSRKHMNWGGIITPEGDLLVNVYVPYFFGNVIEHGGLKSSWEKGFRVAWKYKQANENLMKIDNIDDLGTLFKNYNFQKQKIMLDSEVL